MRSLLLAWGAMALVGCGGATSEVGADAGDGGPEASAPDTGSAPDAAPEASTGQPEAGPNPPTCSGATSYPTSACGAMAVGTMPAPGCAPQGQSCGSPSACAIDESKCGNASTCMPMAQNSGAIADFRMRSLQIAAPPALAAAFVQSAVITKNVDLNLPQCGQQGNGSLSWLLRFDSASQTLTTGGAPPAQDPLGQGFCFYDHVVAGSHVAPSTTCTTMTAGGVQSDIIDALPIPIFLNADPNNVIVLPLRKAQLGQIRVSPDNACIGQFHHAALDSQCTADPTTCAPWTTGGAVGAYITLEDADKVEVSDLVESLCVLLTQSSKDPATNRCKRDSSGNIAFKGDYCATTGTPGGCGDSYWFGATFAASAAKVHDGACL